MKINSSWSDKKTRQLQLPGKILSIVILCRFKEAVCHFLQRFYACTAVHGHGVEDTGYQIKPEDLALSAIVEAELCPVVPAMR